MIMVKPLNSHIAFAPNSMRGGNTYLLESVPVESRGNSSGQIKNRISGGAQNEALVADAPRQPARRGLISKSRKTSNTVNPTRVKRSSTDRSSNTVRRDADSKSNAVVKQQNQVNSNAVNRNTSSSAKSTGVAQNPSTTVSPQANTNANPIAPSASSIAKERSAMNARLNTALQEVLGKEGFVAPTDHRGYTTMIAKAMKKIKDPAQLEAFKAKIEEAGKPFRLNFGVTRSVGGKQEALNSNATGSMSTYHQDEYKKIAAELRTESKKPTQTNGNQGLPVDGTPNNAVTPTPTPTTASDETPIQGTTPQQVPVTETDANPSILPNPELVA
jgi:hypothetical protein